MYHLDAAAAHPVRCGPSGVADEARKCLRLLGTGRLTGPQCHTHTTPRPDGILSPAGAGPHPRGSLVLAVSHHRSVYYNQHYILLTVDIRDVRCGFTAPAPAPACYSSSAPCVTSRIRRGIKRPRGAPNLRQTRLSPLFPTWAVKGARRMLLTGRDGCDKFPRAPRASLN